VKEGYAMNKKDEVSVLFSGGSDSTLVAALMCEQFEKVHLLTFFRSGMHFAEKTKVNAGRLAKRFGKDKIIHRLISFEESFMRLYYEKYLVDAMKYRMYMIPNVCTTCQIAMHMETVLYNIENDIHFVRDGYKREKRHIYTCMTEEGIEELRKFYREYGIDHQSPVYNIVRTDWMLFEMGISPQKNVKFPHEWGDGSGIQQDCAAGALTNMALMGCLLPLHGRDVSKRVQLKYWKEKIEMAKVYINTFSTKRGT